MLKRKALYFFGLLIATVACEKPAPPTSARAAASYNLTDWLQQQTQQLQATQPMVLKSVKTAGKPAETIETSQVNWENELAAFQAVDLSRPALNDLYTESRKTLENGNTEITFTKSEVAATPVQTLQLQVTPSGQLQRLEARVLEKNMLFYSRRNMLLLTNPANGNLASYRIEGVQKLILGDSLHYYVDANL
ncbi:hypothetical protein [Botryobacter ruber]|uniref:hypothetical protein n=1 Tax=Botryobacter ruber TaxID=2171629 RepID=UPI000F64DC7E|nr:hypothetical protein [Botryobacter ruber]